MQPERGEYEYGADAGWRGGGNTGDVHVSIDVPLTEPEIFVAGNRTDISKIGGALAWQWQQSRAAFVATVKEIRHVYSPGRAADPEFPFTEIAFEAAQDFTWLKGRWATGPIPGELVVRLAGGQDPVSGIWNVIQSDAADDELLGQPRDTTNWLLISVGEKYLVFITRQTYTLNPFAGDDSGILRIHELPENQGVIFLDRHGQPLLADAAPCRIASGCLGFGGILAGMEPKMIDPLGGGIWTIRYGGVDGDLLTVAE